MTDIIHIAFAPENLLLTLLLIFFIGMNIVSLIGVLDFDSFDFDVDIDTDFEVDADIDIDAETQTSGAGYGEDTMIELLRFFHFGKMPVLVILTCVVAIMWGISLYVNQYFNNGNLGLSLLYLIPNFIISLFATKFALTPFTGIFGKLNRKGDAETKFEGQVCKVILEANEQKVGQAEANDTGRIITINIKSIKGKILKGMDCVVVDKGKDNYFYVQKVEEI